MTCVVTTTLNWLQETVIPDNLPRPRDFYLGSEILHTVTQICQGQAPAQSLDSLRELARELSTSSSGQAANLGQAVLNILDEQGQILASHIQTRICPDGDCLPLTPAPCQMACPAGIDIPSYLTLVGRQEYEQALQVIRQDTPFAWVCGVACTRPCETECVRACLDEAIDIMHLKGFAASRASEQGQKALPDRAADSDFKVAIVGAGPGGLSTAYFLRLQGHRVTVIEANSRAGGLMRSVIPADRLPDRVLDADLEILEQMGIDFRFQTRFGRDISWPELQSEGFQALVLATGVMPAYQQQIPGEDYLDNVLAADEFLRLDHRHQTQVLGTRVAIVGCGAVGRQAAEQCLARGCSQVTIFDHRARADLPGETEAVTKLEKSGVKCIFQAEPVRIQGHQRQGTAIIYRQTGTEQPEHSLEVETVITAVSPALDGTGRTPMQDTTWYRRFTIPVNSVSMETREAGVFAVGDAVSGLSSIVRCVGGGKKAAAAVDRYLHHTAQPGTILVPTQSARLERLSVSAEKKAELKRPYPQILDAGEDQGDSPGQIERERRRLATEEAFRCLRCDVCIRCGRCARICRNEMGVEALQLHYLDSESPAPTTDLLLTQERCIGCGACAVNCPTAAMQIQHTDTECILSLCGTVLSRQPLVFCRDCGRPLGPQRYLDFIADRIQDLPRRKSHKPLCSACANRSMADMKAPTLA